MDVEQVADEPKVVSDVALTTLSKVFALVEGWRDRSRGIQPSPEPGSSLTGDDKATDPVQLSHAVVEVLISAADHLETVRLVVQEQHVLPARGVFTLLRAALENAAVAVWLLTPTSREDRVFRLLRWEWAGAQDEASALELMAGMTDDPVRSAEIGRNAVDGRVKQKGMLQDLARARGWGADRLSQVCANPKGFGEIVWEAGEAAQGLTGDRAKWVWTICSGLAHSRRWAVLGFLKREVTPGANDDLKNLKISADEERLAVMANGAALMMAEAWRLFDERRRSLLGS